MNIPENEIESKCFAGLNKDDKPVIYIKTVGGLHALFKKDESDKIHSIAAAPSLAIMKWLAEKQEPGLKWNADFGETDIKKAEQEFQSLRKAVFMPIMPEPINQPNMLFVVYNIEKKEAGAMDFEALKESVQSGYLPEFALIRDMALDSSPMFVFEIKEQNKW